ncbi:hypothetical protein FACS1894137_14820 [Spirochaetia bacterium]|nr:hypothetical protein FACS1894137_14820 [Spirochaetia bacterium]
MGNFLNKAIFLDRDGTLNKDFGFVYKTEDLALLPGVVEALQLFQGRKYLLIVITNQSGVGRGFYTNRDVDTFNNELKKELKKENIIIDDFYICMHSPDDNCECRKPSPYLINLAIIDHDIDPNQSYMFGDKQSDITCGKNANIRSFLITKEHTLLYWAKKLESKL